MPLYERFKIFDSLEGFETVSFDDRYHVTAVSDTFPILFHRAGEQAAHQPTTGKTLNQILGDAFFNYLEPILASLQLGGLSNFIYELKDVESNPDPARTTQKKDRDGSPSQTTCYYQCLCTALRHDDNHIYYQLGLRQSDPKRKNDTIAPILLHALNSVDEGIAITDTQHEPNTLIYLNDAMRYDPTTSSHYQLGQPDDITHKIQSDADAPNHGRLVLAKRNGLSDTLTYDVSTTTIRDEHSQISHEVNVHHDMTKTVALQNLLQAMYQSYQRLFDQSPVPMYVIDQDGLFIQVNTTLCEMLDQTATDLLGKNHLLFLYSDTLPDVVLSQHAHFLKTALENETLELQAGSAAGVKHWILFNCAAQTEVGANAQQYLCSWSSIDRTKSAEIQHLLLIEKLQESNFQLEHFAHIASHDLQAPLNKCASYLYLMEDAIDQGKVVNPELLRKAIKSCFDMKLMIKHMLRDAQQSQELEDIVDIPLEACVQTAAENLHSLIARSDAALTVEPLPEVLGNPAQISRVFQNLISNAIKYRSQARPEIKITAKKIHEFCEISIADNGIGIPAHKRETMFRVFEQGDTRNNGQGLGLTICKKIIEQLGGSIAIDSSYGNGTRFIFTLPLAQKLISSYDRHVI